MVHDRQVPAVDTEVRHVREFALEMLAFVGRLTERVRSNRVTTSSRSRDNCVFIWEKIAANLSSTAM